MIKAGMKFLDSDFRIHTITKVTDAYGGGFYHSYKNEKGVEGEGFMPIIAFERLSNCGAIYVLNNSL